MALTHDRKRGWTALLEGAIAFLVAAAPEALATVRQVPLQYPTIQQAINASATGDTVLVSNGVYYEQIDFLGKEISVEARHPLGAAIDAGGKGSCVTIDKGEGPATRLYGFRVIHGYGTADKYGTHMGGGINIVGSQPTIEGCTIRNCAADVGGGISVSDHSIVTIKDTKVMECNLTLRQKNYGAGVALADSRVVLDTCDLLECGTGRFTILGGGLFAINGATTLLTCHLQDNVAYTGGGAYFISGVVDVEKSTFYYNTAFGSGGGAVFFLNLAGTQINDSDFYVNAASDPAEGRGGGLWIVMTRVDMNRCRIYGNQSSYGGGIAMEYFTWSSRLNRCDFRANNARTGGGLYLYKAKGYIADTIVADNHADWTGMAHYGGGGIWSWQSSHFDVFSSTITKNTAAQNGSGVFHYADSSDDYFIVSDSIIWGNDGASQNIVEGNWPFHRIRMQGADLEVDDPPYGYRVLLVDPQFDPSSSNFDLLATSPLIDVGTGIHSPTGDFDGDIRNQDGNGDGVIANDYGAQEF